MAEAVTVHLLRLSYRIMYFYNTVVLVTRPENIKDDRQKDLDGVLSRHPTLKVIRNFVEEFYGLFNGKPRASEAWRRWQCLVSNPRYLSTPILEGALKSVSDGRKFDKICVYLHYKNLDSTSNDVERDNRGYRKRQKTHYRFRTKSSIQRLTKRRKNRATTPFLDILSTPVPTGVVVNRG